MNADVAFSSNPTTSVPCAILHIHGMPDFGPLEQQKKNLTLMFSS